MTDRPRHIGILGAGRAGSALLHNLALAGGTSTFLWSRSETTAKAARAEGLPAISGPLPSALRSSDLVVLAVSDDAVQGLALQLAARGLLASDVAVVHLSGALDLEPLQPLRDLGHPVGSLHPALSIATRRTSFAKCAAAIDAATPALDAQLAALATSLGMFVIRPKGERARYHAAASVVGNFPQVLLEAGIRLLLECGLDRDEAGRALGPLLRSASENAAALGPAAGLTGPIVRGDVDVLRKHLVALATSDASGRVYPLYRAAGRIAVELAAERGAPRVPEMSELLNSK